MDINPLTPEICDQVARLHMLSLPTPFSGRAGWELLNRYYLALSTHQGGTGLVALEGGALTGFICGIWDARKVKSVLLRSHAGALAVWGVLQLLSKPALLVDFAHRFFAMHGPGIATMDDCGQLELRPIVVAPAARGTGLAMQLINRLVMEARERGFRSMCLYAEPDNLPAQRLYARAGFRVVGRKKLESGDFLFYALGAL